MDLPGGIPSRTELELIESVNSIQLGVWVLVLLLVVSVAYIIHLRYLRKLEAEAPDWSSRVDGYFEKGRFDEALQVLKVVDAQFPRHAAVKWWLGRCYFQQNKWLLAAAAFEECLRFDPYYRASVKDYMSFIELNNLVVGVRGYLQ